MVNVPVGLRRKDVNNSDRPMNISLSLSIFRGTEWKCHELCDYENNNRATGWERLGSGEEDTRTEKTEDNRSSDHPGDQTGTKSSDTADLRIGGEYGLYISRKHARFG